MGIILVYDTINGHFLQENCCFFDYFVRNDKGLKKPAPEWGGFQKNSELFFPAFMNRNNQVNSHRKRKDISGKSEDRNTQNLRLHIRGAEHTGADYQ